MGYCICVRVKNVNSSEIKINPKEPNNDISKPFQFLLNSNELTKSPLNKNIFSSNYSQKVQSYVSNNSNDNTINTFSSLIQPNYYQIKDMSQRISLFSLSKANTFSKEKIERNKTPINNYKNNLKYELDSYEDDSIKKTILKSPSLNFNKRPIFSKLYEHSKRNKKLS